MQRSILIACFLLGASACSKPVTAGEPGPSVSGIQAGRLEVQIRGLRGTEGNVVLAVYTNKAEFEQNGTALAWASVPAKSKTIAFADFPEGKVAISAFHDTNRNGRYDMKDGFPLEGWGHSGEISQWSEPTFEAALTELGIVSVNMYYPN